MLDFVIFAVTFLAVLLGAIIWLYPSSKRVTTIPGLDPSTQEDGNLSDIGRAGSLHEFLVDLHGQFGSIAGFWWGQTYVVSIASPELFKQQANIFDKPYDLFRLFEPVIGSSSIQYANGSEGRSRRQHYDRAFAHDRLVKNFEKFNKVAAEVEKKWSQKGEHDHIPLSDDMFIFAIKAALISLMGDSFKDEKLVMSFRNAYDKAWGEVEHRLANPVLPDDNDPRMIQFNEAVKYLQSAVTKVIQHREEHNMRKQGNLLIDDILEFAPSEDSIASDTITYMIGSFHTTGNMLTWCLYFLATHKDVQAKVYKEIKEVLGDNDAVDDDNYEKLKYLSQVLDETLRCAIVAPWGARVQDFDTELGGHKIPKNTPVIQAYGVVFQDETLWPLPNKFDPDRFSPENCKSRSTYAFVPFGFSGKRKCPGYKYAYLEATVLLVTLIRRFEISLWNDQVVQPVFGLVTHPHEEIWVKISKRS